MKMLVFLAKRMVSQGFSVEFGDVPLRTVRLPECKPSRNGLDSPANHVAESNYWRSQLKMRSAYAFRGRNPRHQSHHFRSVRMKMRSDDIKSRSNPGIIWICLECLLTDFANTKKREDAPKREKHGIGSETRYYTPVN